MVDRPETPAGIASLAENQNLQPPKRTWLLQQFRISHPHGEVGLFGAPFLQV